MVLIDHTVMITPTDCSEEGHNPLYSSMSINYSMVRAAEAAWEGRMRGQCDPPCRRGRSSPDTLLRLRPLAACFPAGTGGAAVMRFPAPSAATITSGMRSGRLTSPPSESSVLSPHMSICCSDQSNRLGKLMSDDVVGCRTMWWAFSQDSPTYGCSVLSSLSPLLSFSPLPSSQTRTETRTKTPVDWGLIRRTRAQQTTACPQAQPTHRQACVRAAVKAVGPGLVFVPPPHTLPRPWGCGRGSSGVDDVGTGSERRGRCCSRPVHEREEVGLNLLAHFKWFELVAGHRHTSTTTVRVRLLNQPSKQRAQQINTHTHTPLATAARERPHADPFPLQQTAAVTWKALPARPTKAAGGCRRNTAHSSLQQLTRRCSARSLYLLPASRCACCCARTAPP